MYKFYLYHTDLEKRLRIEDPVGWDGLGKTLKRDMNWHGLFWEYSPKLRFIKSGRAVTANFYNLYGIEAEVYLIVDVLDPVTRRYNQDYVGKLNMTSLKVSTLYAECNIENTGFIQKFKNAQDIKVDLTSNQSLNDRLVNSFTRETVTLHSKTIKKGLDVENVDETVFETDAIFEGAGFPILYSNVGFNDILVNNFDDFLPTPLGLSDTKPSLDRRYVIKFKESGAATIDIQCRFKVSAPGSGVAGFTHRLRVKLKCELWQNDEIFPINETSEVVANGASNSPIDTDYQTYSLTFSPAPLAGDEYYFFIEILYETVASSNPVRVQFDSSSVKNFLRITQDTNFPETQTELLMKHEAFARVVEHNTDQVDVFRSDYYGRTDSLPRSYAVDGEGALRGIVGGGMLRGIDLSKIGFTASFKELFETCRAIDGVGVGIIKEGYKEVVEVEPIRHFYEVAESARFGSVKDIEMEVASDMYYNELEVGYAKWANEESNNLDELASKRSYTLPVSQIKNKLALVSPYIASGYTLEYTRRDRFDLEKDRDEDNDNFVIDLLRDGEDFAPTRNEDFTTLDNILDPGTVYNAKLSISRNVLRNGETIAASLYKQPDGKLKVSFKEGNAQVISQLLSESDPLNENANITITQLGVPIWIPEYYTFKTKPTLEQVRAIYANPRRYISFSENEKTFIKGYLVEMNPDQKTRETEFKLLRANL